MSGYEAQGGEVESELVSNPQLHHLATHFSSSLAPPRLNTHDVEDVEGQKAVLGTRETPTHLGGLVLRSGENVTCIHTKR